MKMVIANGDHFAEVADDKSGVYAVLGGCRFFIPNEDIESGVTVKNDRQTNAYMYTGEAWALVVDQTLGSLRYAPDDVFLAMPCHENIEDLPDGVSKMPCAVRSTTYLVSKDKKALATAVL